MPQLLAARASAGQPEGEQISARADACIVIYLNGGPSHLDMWDMKPDGPAEIRGEFGPIATSLPGVSLCEHLPRLADHMHRLSLVRSMNHSVNNSHAAAVYAALTGHDRGEQGGGGIRGGQTIGTTDDVGLHAVEDRLHVHDLHATILHLLGLDHMRVVYNYKGRPERPTLNEGSPCWKLIG